VLSVVLRHPAVNVVEKGVVVPGFFRVQEACGQRLAHPGDYTLPLRLEADDLRDGRVTLMFRRTSVQGCS
jgi:hypothetical protein